MFLKLNFEKLLSKCFISRLDQPIPKQKNDIKDHPGGTMGYAAVGYKPAKAVQYWNKSDFNEGAVLAVKDVFDFE